MNKHTNLEPSVISPLRQKFFPRTVEGIEGKKKGWRKSNTLLFPNKMIVSNANKTDIQKKAKKKNK